MSPVHRFNPPRRFSLGRCVTPAVLAASLHFAMLTAAQAGNTENDLTAVSSTASLTLGTNWSLSHVPTVSEDATYSGTTTGIRSLTAANLTVGSFNVTGSSGTFSIQNKTATATDSTLTLGGAGNLGNMVAPNSADLLYVATGATFNLRGDNGGGGTGVLKVVLGQSGNFDVAGTMNISAAISDGGNNFGVTKTGAGTLTYSAANTYSGGTTITAGTLRMSGSGTLGSTSGALAMSGGFLDLNGTNQAVGALNGTGGTIYNSLPSGGGSPKTLTVGTGGTDINGGVLISNSSNGGALGRGPITVNSGGTLAGAQTIDKDATITVNSGGTLMPGTTASAGSVAKLSTGSITFASGSTFAIDLNSGAGATGTGAGTIYDQVSITGALTLAGALTVNPGSGLAIGDKFFITLNDGIDTVSGTFSGLANLSTFSTGGDTFLINYFDNGDGFANDISLTVIAVPEPSTWIAAALVLVAVAYRQGRRFARR